MFDHSKDKNFHIMYGNNFSIFHLEVFLMCCGGYVQNERDKCDCHNEFRFECVCRKIRTNCNCHCSQACCSRNCHCKRYRWCRSRACEEERGRNKHCSCRSCHQNKCNYPHRCQCNKCRPCREESIIDRVYREIRGGC